MPRRDRMEIIRRIQKSGYLCEFDIADHFNLPKLTIENNPDHSFVFVFYGGMGFIFELRITADQVLEIQDFGDIELSGQRCNVDWWLSETTIYKFDRGPEYPRDVVLNHRKGIVKPGRPLEGILLGRSLSPIPRLYSHGFQLPLTFSIIDGFDNGHSAKLFAKVDDNLWFKHPNPARTSLFEPRSGEKCCLEDAAEASRQNEGPYELLPTLRGAKTGVYQP